MTVEELRDRRRRGDDLVLVDVREHFERDYVRLEDSAHIPLACLPGRWRDLDPQAPTVVYCHHGVRSVQAVVWLLSLGFAEVHNLEGGIDAWSERIEPGLPRY
jgi:adenylyltransferase/sulfurtransferase